MEIVTYPCLRSIFRWLATIGLVFMLVACGFHLRKDFKLAFRSMYLEIPSGSYITYLINRLNRGIQMTEIVRNPKEAEVILTVSPAKRKQKILSYDNYGLAREYALYYRVTFSLRTQEGQELIKPTTITLRRTMTYSNTEDLAKEREIDVLYAEMQQEVVQQILHRLSKVSIEKEEDVFSQEDALPQQTNGEDKVIQNQNAETPEGMFQIEPSSR